MAQVSRWHANYSLLTTTFVSNCRKLLLDHEILRTKFFKAISNALSSSGMLVTPIDASYYNQLDDLLEQLGFECVMKYEEAHARSPASFAVALKDTDSRMRWFATEAEVGYVMRLRLVPTHSGNNPLLYFDGATMESYQRPPHIAEERFCANRPEICREGHGFNPEVAYYSETSFEVKPSKIAHGGRGVFAKEFIHKGSYLFLDDCVQGMFVPPLVYKTIETWALKSEGSRNFWDTLYWGYLDGYGWTDAFYVSKSFVCGYGVLYCDCSIQSTNPFVACFAAFEGRNNRWSRCKLLYICKSWLSRLIQHGQKARSQ